MPKKSVDKNKRSAKKAPENDSNKEAPDKTTTGNGKRQEKAGGNSTKNNETKASKIAAKKKENPIKKEPESFNRDGSTSDRTSKDNGKPSLPDAPDPKQEDSKQTITELTFASWNCSRPKWIEHFKPEEDIVAIQFSKGQRKANLKSAVYKSHKVVIFTPYNAILLKKESVENVKDDDEEVKDDDEYDPRIVHFRTELKVSVKAKDQPNNLKLNIFSVYFNASEVKKAAAEDFYEKLNAKIDKTDENECILLMASLGSAKERPNASKLESKDSYIDFLNLNLKNDSLKELVCENTLENNPETQCTYREQAGENAVPTSRIDYVYYSKNFENYYEKLQWKNPTEVVKGRGTQHLKIKGVFYNGKAPARSYDHSRIKGEACEKEYKKLIPYVQISMKELPSETYGSEEYIHLTHKDPQKILHFYIGKKYTDVKDGKITVLYRKKTSRNVPATKAT